MAKKKKRGRPSTYDPIYCDKIIEFFDIEPINYKDVTMTYKNGDTVEKTIEEAAPIPWFSDFEKSIGISAQTLKEWVRDYPAFSEAYKRAKVLQTQFIMTNALRNNFNGVFAIFTLKNVARWRDEDDLAWGDRHEITGKDGGAIEVKYDRSELVSALAELMKIKKEVSNGKEKIR